MNNPELIEAKKQEISDLKKSFKKKNYSVKDNQRKLEYKLLKKKAKTFRKVSNDIETITNWISELNDGEVLKVISNKIDSPSFINATIKQGNIKECFISTWAITDAGLLALKTLQDMGAKITVLLDITHSYKWTFQSGAFKMLENATFVFTENHSKFQTFLFNNNKSITYVGSFNLSNNPRYENVEISKDIEDYKFYSIFVNDVLNDKNNTQNRLFDV